MRSWYASLLLIAGLFSSPAAQAQEKKVRTVSFEGMEFFCHILHELGMKPITNIHFEELDPQETVVIVLGQPQVLEQINWTLAGLGQYVNQGGSLLVATDYPCFVPGLPIRIADAVVTEAQETAYLRQPQCPWLPSPNLEAGLLGGPGHPLFHFLNQGIATNGPSWIRFEPGQTMFMGLLAFSPDAFYHQPSDRGQFKVQAPRARYYMAGSAADARPHGRTLVIAGHGMFMNGMMLQSSNDNFDFTVNAIKWLREKEDGKRTRALFVVDGKIITDFNANLSPPPPPIPLPTVTALNRLLRGLEDERFFHRVLASLVEPERVVALMFGLGTFALLLYGVKKFMEGRHHLETTVPLLVGAPAPNTIAVPVIQQRQQDLIRQNNFWEEARTLVREWFREQFDVAPEQWTHEAPQGVQLQGGAALRRQVDYVMLLARAAKPIKVTHHEFVWLAQVLLQLTLAVKHKHLTLLEDGKKTRGGEPSPVRGGVAPGAHV